MPVVVLGTKASCSGTAPRNSESWCRASSQRGSKSRLKNWTGSFSTRSRRCCCASKTASGQAPKEPWLRKVTEGSSVQYRAHSDEQDPRGVSSSEEVTALIPSIARRCYRHTLPHRERREATGQKSAEAINKNKHDQDSNTHSRILSCPVLKVTAITKASRSQVTLEEYRYWCYGGSRE